MLEKLTPTLIFFSLLSIANCQLGASCGEPCGEEIRCDPRALLSCINSTCECIKPKEMTYEKDKKQCVVIMGGKCAYPEEKLDCVKNATCSTTTGFCECIDSNHYGNSDGLCVLKGLHGANCQSDRECLKDKGLSCVENMCSCNVTEAIFDPEGKKCVQLAGAPCHCDRYGWNRYEDNNCIKSARCEYDRISEKYLCSCNYGYLKNDRGLCLQTHGSRCDADNPCHDEFVCVQGTCKCPFSFHQRYDESLSKCVSLVRGPCLENVDGIIRHFPCVNHAVCSNSTGIYECTCENGWIESSRYCSLAFGQSCSNKLIGSNNDGLCDPSARLVCRNDKCACQDDLQIYDVKKQKCRGMIGAYCKPVPENKDGDDGEFCIDGAYCDPFRDPNPSKANKGVCRCYSQGFTLNSNRSICF